MSEPDEFALIGRLLARAGRRRSDVTLGAGDDVAAIDLGAGRLLLLTCDAQVEGTHFLVGRCDPQRLGRKALAINVSDVAAAGGRPAHLLCSIVAPVPAPCAFLEAFYAGLDEEAARWGVELVGGNVSRGPALVFDLTLAGEASAGRLWRRSGARPGDRLLVTGSLGAAAAGRRLAHEGPLAIDADDARAALDAFETPVPRLAEAVAADRAGGVTAAIDVSDGLAADLLHLCRASAVGVRLDADRIPVGAGTRAIARAAGEQALDWALGGGEDYELLWAAAPGAVEALIREVVQESLTPVTEIGEFLPSEVGCTLAGRGGVRPLGDEGWRHF